METMKYQTLVKQTLQRYAEFLSQPPTPPYQAVTVFDDEHRHYLLRKLGWTPKRRIRQTVVHVALHDEKIWIEEDWTEEGIATYLLERGVPEEDIVLAFQPPQLRQRATAAVV